MIPPSARRSSVGRVVAVVVAGIALYVLMPALVKVLSSWPRLLHLQVGWLVAGLAG